MRVTNSIRAQRRNHRMNTRISRNGKDSIGASKGNGVSLLEPNESTNRTNRVLFERQLQSSRKANGDRARKAKLLAPIVAAVFAIAGFGYWLHSRNFQSTDDAYTITHVHDISARVA